MYFLVTCPVHRHVYLDAENACFICTRTHCLRHCCQTVIVHGSVCCAVSTVIDVVRVLCGCMVTSHLLGTLTDATHFSGESVALHRISTIYLHFNTLRTGSFKLFKRPLPGFLKQF